MENIIITINEEDTIFPSDECSIFLKFLTLDTDIKDEISKIYNRDPNNAFLNIIGYFSSFTIKRSISFSVYYQYIYDIIKIIAEICNHQFKNDIEIKIISLAFIKRTSTDYSKYAYLLSDNEISHMSEMDMKDSINIWASYIISKELIQILDPRDNLNSYISILSIFVKNRDKYESINNSLPKFNPIK